MIDKERLQKILSQAGVGSRRQMEVLIADGRVSVNGKVAKIGDSAGPKDMITVNGNLVDNPLDKIIKTRIVLYHKPVGEISSKNDPHHTKTVFENLPYLKIGRWVQVGRLDINTSGLLIFTNNGELANQLMHPKHEFEREYSVRVHGTVTDAMTDALLKGVMLDDGKASFKKITFQGGEGRNTWFNVILTEGKNREVRRLWESQGVEVSRLIRIRYGHIKLPRSLSRGECYELSIKEVEDFLARL
jgi:23S rRNA pseudouridine2605 synthase